MKLAATKIYQKTFGGRRAKQQNLNLHIQDSTTSPHSQMPPSRHIRRVQELPEAVRGQHHDVATAPGEAGHLGSQGLLLGAIAGLLWGRTAHYFGMYVRTYVRTYVCTYVCVYIHIYHVCPYLYVYVCVYIHISYLHVCTRLWLVSQNIRAT